MNLSKEELDSKLISLGIVPDADRVLIIRDPVKDKVTRGNIIVPKEAQKKDEAGLSLATVVICGSGNTDIPMDLKTNDRVIVSSYAGSSFTFKGYDFVMVRRSDISGRINRAAEGDSFDLKEIIDVIEEDQHTLTSLKIN